MNDFDMDALQGALRHLIQNVDTYMDDYLEARGLWPALTKGFAESYREGTSA